MDYLQMRDGFFLVGWGYVEKMQLGEIERASDPFSFPLERETLRQMW